MKEEKRERDKLHLSTSLQDAVTSSLAKKADEEHKLEKRYKKPTSRLCVCVFVCLDPRSYLQDAVIFAPAHKADEWHKS